MEKTPKKHSNCGIRALAPGVLLSALVSGALKEIAGTLYDLCGGRVEGRRSAAEITVFKSVGLAVEDLAAARVALAARRQD